MYRWLISGLTMLAFLGFAGTASATLITIDFNTLIFNNNSVDNLAPSPYVEDGFAITSGRPLSIAGTARPEFLGTPSAHLRVSSGPIDLGLSMANGSLFDLVSIDLSILHPNGSSPPVNFFAFDASNTFLGSQTFAPTIFGLQTFTFSSIFQDVARVRWQQGTGDFFAHQFDNIVVQVAVPEPSTIGLFGIGLLALGFAGRRRKQRGQQTQAV